jgi:DNA-binding MarR family transcriptional regulator
MADINKRFAKCQGTPPKIGEEAVREGIELLFFAYRDFTAEPDAILAEYGFGRAHHRVVHFVGRHPEMTVGELLSILRITKQSLSRVLGELVRLGFIIQRRGPDDRRQRLLALTDSGRELERRLSAPQRARVAAAYRAAGAGAVAGFRKVLIEILADQEDRGRFERDDDTDEPASATNGVRSVLSRPEDR